MAKPNGVKVASQKAKHESVKESNKQQNGTERWRNIWNPFNFQKDKQSSIEEPVEESNLRMARPISLTATPLKDTHESVEELNKQQKGTKNLKNQIYHIPPGKPQTVSRKDVQSSVEESVAGSTLKMGQQDSVKVAARKDKQESVKSLTKDSLLFGKTQTASRKDKHSSFEDLIKQQKTAEDCKKLWNHVLKVPGNDGILLRKVTI